MALTFVIAILLSKTDTPQNRDRHKDYFTCTNTHTSLECIIHGLDLTTAWRCL